MVHTTLRSATDFATGFTSVVMLLLCSSLTLADEIKKGPSGPAAIDQSPARKHYVIPPVPKDSPTWTDADTALKEFPGFVFLGEYIRANEALQVAVHGERFYVSKYSGGLPGAGWDGSAITHVWSDASSLGKHLDGFKKVDRSAKVGKANPPQGAIVLFDGSDDKSHWAFGKIEGGLLKAGAKTKRKDFQDFKLHFEVLVPFKPKPQLSHPARGNSGVFALGCYEIQVCDTFGLDLNEKAWETERMLKHPNTASGSIYGIYAAEINMCLPPLSWESFDIDFTAARFDDSGEKTTNARITVVQNGVKVHDNVELPRGTGGGPSGPRPEVAKGPIYVQSHGNPNLYRNIWVVEKTNATK